MAKIFTPESELENNLIEQLIHGKSQWTYREDLENEESLWANFRKILEGNNRAVLDGVPLTEQEFGQVKNQITFASFYAAAIWLTGENGIAKVRVQREDASLGIIWLNVINQNDIAGGSTVYEVINQYWSDKRDEQDRNRRFDVTLLINGLPMIHIELKSRRHPYMDAFRQIKKYLVEDKFNGIYSSLQMFVVSNGTQTRYIAAARADSLKETFLTKWVDTNNEPVQDCLSFAKEVLSIPAAHKMVAQYSVLDRDSNSVILLRPYQIHALESVRQASKRRESGYVWHTTGSGKTLTSYKVARNLLQIPSIDKTIFIVDRRDLNQQTTSQFEAYSEFDTVDVDESTSVNGLEKHLLSNDRTVIVTTIQKLNIILGRYNQDDMSASRIKRKERLKKLNLAFIVDECHRAVTPSKAQELNKFFSYALWYGFTGTPIFKENAREALGDLARTTEEQYGKRLHQYTVKEAINDGSVLGFQIEYKHTIEELSFEEAVEKVAKSKGKSTNELTQIEKEKLFPKEFYETKEHRLQVIDSIVNQSGGKLGFRNGVNDTYEAILSVNSIAEAQEYYRLFKSVVAGNEDVVVKERSLKVLPDFPKVAITYSVTENEDGSIDNQIAMKEAMADYNEMFGTNFGLETIDAYNANINERLARKHSKYRVRKEQLDLVIVVDRLLTGFDAPALSTLFVDRPPLRPQHLIQAFSRTNRIFDQAKTYGQIVTFRTPATYEEAVKYALKLYSNGGENFVVAPEWEETKENFLAAIKELKAIAQSPDAILEFTNQEEKKRFLKAYQTFDKCFMSAQVYSEYNPDDFLPALINVDEIQEYHGHYVNILEELKGGDDTNGGDGPPLEFDIEYEIQSVKTDEINYEYILMLIQDTIKQKDEKQASFVHELNQKAIDEINQYIKDLQRNNPNLAKLIANLWQQIQDDPSQYANQNVKNLLEKMINDNIDSLVEDFVNEWAVDYKDFRFLVDNYNPNKEEQIGAHDLRKSSDYEKYKMVAEEPVKYIVYPRNVRNAYTKMIEENILPLRDVN